MNWVNKLYFEVIEEEDGGCTIHIEWNEADSDLTEWTAWGEEKQKSFILDALTNVLNCYVD